MAVNPEDLAEWLGNPTTIFFFEQIEAQVAAEKDTQVYTPGTEMDAGQTAMACAYQEGVVVGLSEVLNIREEFKEGIADES